MIIFAISLSSKVGNQTFLKLFNGLCHPSYPWFHFIDICLYFLLKCELIIWAWNSFLVLCYIWLSNEAGVLFGNENPCQVNQGLAVILPSIIFQGHVSITDIVFFHWKFIKAQVERGKKEGGFASYT